MSQNESTRVRRNFFVLLYVALLTMATMYSPQPLLSSIQASYPQYQDTTISLIMAVVLMPLAIAPLVYGFYLRSMDIRNVLIGSIVIMSLSGIGVTLCTNFWGQVGFRLCQGLVIPSILTCLMAQISNKFSGTQLQRAMAIYIGVTILGGVIGRLSAGFIASWLGWRYTFAFFGMALLPAVFALLRIPSRGTAHMAHVSVTDMVNICKTPGVGMLLGVEACILFITAAVTNYLPFHLTEIGAGISEWHISLLYMGNAIGTYMAFNSRRVVSFLGGEARTIRWGLCIIFFGLPTLMCDNLWFIFITLCVISTGQFLAHTICPGVVNRLSTGDKGAVNGVYLSAYYSGGALGTYAPGFIYNYLGWDNFICVLMGAVFLGLLRTCGLGKYLGTKLP